MFDDVSAHYHENVVQAYDDYLATRASGVAGRSLDVRDAVIAAGALFHFREFLPDPLRPSRADVERACPDYALLGDIANASKHQTLTSGTPHGAPLIAEAAQVSEQVVVTEYEDADGQYQCAEKVVRVTLNDGSVRDVLEVLSNVMNYWNGFLHTHKFAASSRSFGCPAVVEPRTREECRKSSIDVEIVPGLRFRQSFLWQRYDRVTGKIVPVDHSSANVTFRLRKKQFDLDLVLTNSVSGATFKRTVALTEAETDIADGISDSQVRQAFIQSIPSVQAAARELAKEAGLAAPRANSAGPAEEAPAVKQPKELRLSNSSFVPESHVEFALTIFGRRAPRWLERLVECFWPPCAHWAKDHEKHGMDSR